MLDSQNKPVKTVMMAMMKPLQGYLLGHLLLNVVEVLTEESRGCCSGSLQRKA
jgi:hypothetical protein